jgi:hypothetical protein
VQTLLPKALSKLVTSYNLIAVCARIAKLDTQQLHASIVPKVYHDRNSMIGLAKFNPVMKCDECKDHRIQTRLKVLSQISLSTSKVSKQMCPSRKHRKLHVCLTREQLNATGTDNQFAIVGAASKQAAATAAKQPSFANSLPSGISMWNMEETNMNKQ